MSEKVKLDLKEKKNISKAKSPTEKTKIIRTSQTPLKVQSNNKIYLNNNSNTMINPNNNYNINNNISININIDMTNERNKSFNLKNKPKSKKNPTDIKKVQYAINNNSLIFNTLKNLTNKSNIKKSPFHIRIKSANYGFKDFKFKPNENARNKVYQNRLNYYYNISNKNNFNIFSHKFETKKENNNNITDNNNKNISLNEKSNKLNKNNKKNEKILSKATNQEQNKKKISNKNTNTNSEKYSKKRNYFSPINKEPLNKNNKNKNQSTTPNHSSSNTKLNSSIDNRKLNQKNSKKNNNIKNVKVNNRNISTSPFFQKGINNTINYEKNNKNKINNKNTNIFKSPENYKFANSIFKNKNNFRSPLINNKNKSKENKINKPNIQKENNINNSDNNKQSFKKEKEEIIKVNKEINEPIKDEKEKEKEKEPEIQNINKIVEIKQEENPSKEINKKDSSVQNNNEEKEKEASNIIINEKKEESNINKEKEEENNNILNPPKSESEIASSFLNELFQNSLPLEVPSISISPNPPKKQVIQIESICKIGYSGPGVKKKNQDNFFIYKNFINDKDTIFLGVCDGHGMFGHDISNYLVNNLPQNLHSDLIKENLSTINNDSDFQKISDIVSNTFVQTNINLVNDSSIDCTYSGTTCSSLIFSPEKIISINVGDSRCVLGKFKDNKWSAINLTRDHKPTEQDEKKRIIEKGGRIEPYKDDSGEAVGPERVWLKEENLPGLAMSRSFGDDVAHMIGVTSKPEIMEFKVNEEDKFILLASDGIFEFITSDEAVNMVKDFYLKEDINGALNHLYKISSQRWIMEEEVIDDITLIIMFLK